MEDDGNDILHLIEEWRKRDPGYKLAIDAFVAAEVGNPDPLEGEVIVEGNPETPRPAP